jgi:aryl-alcohol dehydrogenase-like predicted oxidoreductase
MATTEGASRYAARFPLYREAGFFRDLLGPEISTLGAGTYLGNPDDATDAAYIETLVEAASSGINLFDTAINYRHQRSERAIGAVLRTLARDEFVVSTKAGFLTPGAVPQWLKPEHTVGRMHCLEPDFLADQIDRSRANLGVDSLDIFYLHNPETQIGFVGQAELEARIGRAFERLESLAAGGAIGCYGIATWDGFRQGALRLPRLAEIAREIAGAAHRFRCLQFPFHMGMVDAYVGGEDSLLSAAARLGIACFASATLAQTLVLRHAPASLVRLTPDLTAAQRAIQFTRSTPGVAAALVGMSRREHVVENLGVAPVAPIAPDQYLQLYR